MIRRIPLAGGGAPRAWRPRPAFPRVELGLAAGMIALVYGLALVVTRPVWASAPPPLAAPAPEPMQPLGWPAVVLIMAFSLLLCAPYRPYVLALRTAASGVVSSRCVLGLTAALAGVAVLGYPRSGLGSDIFDYIGAERVWAIYHDNPLLVAASSHPSDWAYALMAFGDHPSPYGPLWVLLTAPIVWLAGDAIPAYIAAYKLLSLAAYVACCALIWGSVEPRRRVRALIVFGWSPLVLVDVLGTLHNDGLAAVGVTLAVVLAGRARPAAGLLAGVAGALVKASALAIAPVLVLQELRARRWGSLVVGLTGAGVLVGLSYAPFWAGLDTPRTLVQLTGRVIWSPATLLILASGWLPGGPYASAARPILALACGLACLLVVRAPRLVTLREIATTGGWVLLLGLLLLTSVFYAHYLVPVVALAALSGDRRLEQLVTALSLGGMAAYGLDQLYAALGPSWYGSTAYQLIGSLMTLAPAGLVCLSWRPWARPRLARRVGVAAWR